MRSNGPERQQDSHVDAQLLHRIRPRAEPEARVTRDRRAAAYLRVSNSRQTASLDLQRHEVERYASENGHEIVAVYEDRGISGLTLHRRPGLSQLLFDIVAGQAAFKQVLVLDVSRWGRFQDPDEAAHYEFVCRAHHVSIVYCRDPVTDDARGSLVKQVKRVMAADYSRQISERARHGKRRAMEAGHAPGAWPRYLAGRQIIEADGDLGPLLKEGESRSRPEQWIKLVPPKSCRQAVVLRIFKMFASGGLSMAQIAQALTDDGFMWVDGTPWTRRRVARTLRHSLAMGMQSYGRTRTVLGVRGPQTDKDRWGEVQVFDPVVSKRLFVAVQARFAALGGRKAYTDEELLQGLTRLAHAHGRVSVDLINRCPELPSFRWYEARFGSLTLACRRAGFERTALRRGLGDDGEPLSRDAVVSALRRLKAEKGKVTASAVLADSRLPSLWRIRQLFGSLTAARVEAGCL